jgi:trehalose synthase
VAQVPGSAQLLLAGPESQSIDDDPEAAETVSELVRCWGQLPDDARRRVHICSIPMDDVEENAAVVNALQRRADVVVQKSLAEGFGLTVAEAMWKGRPTVGSRVGGIQDQIESGRSGLLVDPSDAIEIGSAITSVLEDASTAAELGQAGRWRVVENYLAPSLLTRQFALIRQVLDRAA